MQTFLLAKARRPCDPRKPCQQTSVIATYAWSSHDSHRENPSNRVIVHHGAWKGRLDCKASSGNRFSARTRFEWRAITVSIGLCCEALRVGQSSQYHVLCLMVIFFVFFTPVNRISSARCSVASNFSDFTSTFTNPKPKSLEPLYPYMIPITIPVMVPRPLYPYMIPIDIPVMVPRSLSFPFMSRRLTDSFGRRQPWVCRLSFERCRHRRFRV